MIVYSICNIIISKSFYIKGLIIAILVIFGHIVKAQDTTSVSTQMWNVMYMYWNMGYVDGNLSVEYDTELSGDKEYYSLSIEPGVEYYPNNSFDIYSNVYIDYTQQQKDETSTEIRPILGARWNIIKPEHRFYLKLQAQFEYRFFFSHNMETQDNSGRTRLMLNNQVSLNQANYDSDQNLYLITKFEYFFHHKENINERFWNESRIYAGLGYKKNTNWQIEALYIYQGSRDNRSEERSETIENIVELTFKLNLFRKNKNSD